MSMERHPICPKLTIACITTACLRPGPAIDPSSCAVTINDEGQHGIIRYGGRGAAQYLPFSPAAARRVGPIAGHGDAERVGPSAGDVPCAISCRVAAHASNGHAVPGRQPVRRRPHQSRGGEGFV